jgi:hypothetical protein
MALVINDRVKETATTTGTGAISLSGAVSGFETFAAGIGNSNTTYYCIAHQDQAEFEVGLGTLDGDSSDLTRTTVISSSNSDSAVNFSSGTKDVFCTMPASKLVFEDASSDVTLPNDLILGSDSSVLKFGADSDITVTHAADTGLTTNGTFQATTITATTAFVPDAADGASLGTTSLEFSDLFLADGATIKFGNDQDINITHVADTGLTTNGDFTVGDDLTVSGGVIDLKNTGSQSVLRLYCESSNAHYAQLQAPAHSAFSGNTTLTLPATTDTITGIAATQTLTNKSIDSDNNTITNIVNADIKSDAAIADSKLATISTAGKVDIGALEIDGATDIGAALVDADLIIVDDGANGTERKSAMSRVATYIQSGISGDITISSGTAAIGSGVIVNADVNASAAIEFSKMENLTTSRALVSDGNGDVSVSAVTSTEIGYLDGVTSSIQTQLDSGASVGKAIAMAIVFG